MMLPIQTSYLRPRAWPILVPLVASAVLLIFARRPENTYYVNLMCLMFLVFSILLWVNFKKRIITVDDKGLTYKTLFSTKEILWEDVIKTYIKYKHYGKSGKHIWFLIGRFQKDLRFSTSFYSRESLQIIAQSVITKCPQAQIEDRILKMAEGKFPWYIF